MISVLPADSLAGFDAVSRHVGQAHVARNSQQAAKPTDHVRGPNGGPLPSGSLRIKPSLD